MADALSRQNSLLTTMHSTVLGFASFADMYPKDPFFARIYQETEQHQRCDYTVMVFFSRDYVFVFRNAAYVKRS